MGQARQLAAICPGSKWTGQLSPRPHVVGTAKNHEVRVSTMNATEASPAPRKGESFTWEAAIKLGNDWQTCPAAHAQPSARQAFEGVLVLLVKRAAWRKVSTDEYRPLLFAHGMGPKIGPRLAVFVGHLAAGVEGHDMMGKVYRRPWGTSLGDELRRRGELHVLVQESDDGPLRAWIREPNGEFQWQTSHTCNALIEDPGFMGVFREWRDTAPKRC